MSECAELSTLLYAASAQRHILLRTRFACACLTMSRSGTRHSSLSWERVPTLEALRAAVAALETVRKVGVKMSLEGRMFMSPGFDWYVSFFVVGLMGKCAPAFALH